MGPIGSRQWWIRLGPLALAACVASAWIDWRPGHEPSTRVVESFVSATGPVRAGAVRLPLDLPGPVTIAGYPRSNRAPTMEGGNGLAIRSLAIEAGGRRVVLVSAELLLIPSPLRLAVLERLERRGSEVDALILTATHTHSGPGGFWDQAVAERFGVGRFDDEVEAHLADRIASAVMESLDRLAPARLSTGRIEASNFTLNRNGFGVTDPLLTAVRVDSADGTPLGRLIVYGAHPTIVPRDHPALSGDWPQALMETLEGDGSVALFMQGAQGDVTWGKRAGDMTRLERAIRFGRAVASDARGALGVAGVGEPESGIAYSRVRVSLPPASAQGFVPGILVRPASNLLHRVLNVPSTEVTWLRLGDARFAFLPAEPVAELGIAWRRMLDGATVVSLADDYVGYLELPIRVEAKEGEAKRSYFGPSLAPVLLDALRTARDAVESEETLVDR